MAANFWESTQRRHWQFTKDELAAMRQKLEDEDPNLVQMYPLPHLRHLNIYFNQQINRLGKRLGVRQQPMATAQLYTKRFYTRVEIRRTNPYLLMATAVYLACKMEECPQHIRLVAGEARSLWPNEIQSIDTGKVGECEFFLISEMSSHLIVHQPYRTLTTLQGDFGLTPDEAALAWSIINDHYMTDLPLLYPPHIIALTAMVLALVLRPAPTGSQGGSSNTAAGLAAASAVLAQAQARAAITGGNNDSSGRSGSATPSLTSQSSSESQAAQLPGLHPGVQRAHDSGMASKKAPEDRLNKVTRFAGWLADSNIDIEAMVDCTQELIAFYECHEQYNDKHAREQINRFIKARQL
ncbi:cyclin-C [Cercophora newfieldiana]|uniref:RNA polymerase II holoenzyme cyclin-like subunit n=1 Tax=Cercophora newfieldiana TaxID=92897 RepID=A0AA39XSB6_9PEZI|nr:cyclin-C [Cercophora newfieldiana]